MGGWADVCCYWTGIPSFAEELQPSKERLAIVVDSVHNKQAILATLRKKEKSLAMQIASLLGQVGRP